MAYQRPTLQQIIERKIADLDSRLPTASARLRRSVLNALLRASAAVEHGLYGYIAHVAKQIVPDRADGEHLERYADWWGVIRTPAVASVGTVDVIGTGTVPAGALMQRADGVEYVVNAELIVAGTGTLSVTSTTLGKVGNDVAGAPLSFISPIAGIQSAAVVGALALTGGADVETDDALRARLRERVQKPPHGGSKFDYDRWAKEVAGVTRVWTMPQWLGEGTVGVFVVRDNDANMIPDAAEIQAVQDYIDTVRPITARVTVLAPIPAPQDFTIQIAPFSTEIKAAVEAEITDLLRREAAVEDGSGSGAILISHIREAVSIAAGEHNHVLGAPSADIALAQGHIATLGTITVQSL